MGYFLDRLSVYLIVFLALLVVARLLKWPLWLSFGIAISAAVLLALIVRNTRKSKRNLRYRDFATYCMLQGDSYVRDLIKDLAGNRYEDCGQWIHVDGKDVFLWVKFGGISADTAANFYRVCRDNGIRKAYLLSAAKDRKNTALIRRYCDAYFVSVDLKALYNALAQAEKLPNIKPKKLPFRHNVRLALSVAFTRKNGVRLLAAAAVMVGVSFLTPFTTYYLTISAITLILAAACMFAKQ